MALLVKTYIDEKNISETDLLLIELERSRIALSLLKNAIGAEHMA